MKFKNMSELNDYINRRPNFIQSVDIDKKQVLHSEQEGVNNHHRAYIIFSDSVELDRFLEAHEVNYTLSSINAVEVTLEVTELLELKKLYKTKYIEIIDPTEVVETTGVLIDRDYYKDIPNWAGVKNGTHKAWAKGYSGQGVNIAIIDSGFKLDIPELPFENFVTFGVPHDGTTAGHGTFCASVIGARLTNDGRPVGMAYGANLYAVGIDSDTPGTTNSADAMKGLNWCAENDIDIVSVSWGSYNTPTTTQETILETLYNKGTLVCASGGNMSGVFSPGMSEYTVSVGEVWANSEYGLEIPYYNPQTNKPWLDFWFSGNVVSYPARTEGGYSIFQGSSCATPGIAGYLAVLKSKFPEKTNDEIIAIAKSKGRTVEGREGIFPIYDNHNKITDSNISLNLNGEVKRATAIQINNGVDVKAVYKVQTKRNGKVIDI